MDFTYLVLWLARALEHVFLEDVIVSKKTLISPPIFVWLNNSFKIQLFLHYRYYY